MVVLDREVHLWIVVVAVAGGAEPMAGWLRLSEGRQVFHEILGVMMERVVTEVATVLNGVKERAGIRAAGRRRGAR